MPPLISTPMPGDDDFSDISELTEFSVSPKTPKSLEPLSRAESPALSTTSSDLSSAKSLSPPPVFRRPLSPPASQDAGEDMPRPRKRRKLEPKVRTTQHLDLTSDAAQSEYDRTQSLELLLTAIRKRRKIVVIAGAGISVAAGIPDFRSSKGLFRSLRAEHKLKSSGKELFDAAVYKDDSSTSSFHDMVCQLSQLSKDAQPTLFHRLLARLSSEGRLLRLYTQNVDGLENRLPPLTTEIPLPHKGPWPKTIQVHGGLEKMVCQKCRQISDFNEELFHGSVPPPCPECQTQDSIRTVHAGKRSHGIGRLRPRIVLYNEHNPDDEAIGAVTAADFRTRPDCVIVVGTSMKIPAIKRITHEMCKIVRDRREGTTIWVNRDPAPPGVLEDCWDLTVKGDADDVAQRARLREWDDTTPDVIESCTDSDVEKSKLRHGIPTVRVPSPKKTLQKALVTPATPPLSPRPAKVEHGGAVPKLKFVLNPPKHPDGVPVITNPASRYKPLKSTSLIAGTKDAPLKKTPKLQNKRAPSRPKQQKPGPMAAFGKVTKTTESNVALKKEAEPLSPKQNSPFVIKLPLVVKQEFSSADSTPYPESPRGIMASTPPAQVAQPRPSSSKSNKETISPSSIPRGMGDLLSFD